ncbi:MAG: hypothetical protein HY225_01340 [Candidatus Vogelbacteria bacterium]|nr:hypothetical protein [Candidatus Vogelbacteria bacterium]
MTQEGYVPLENKFDCSADRHNFENSDVTNLSKLRDLDSPLMWIMLMQLGDVTCEKCAIKQVVCKRGMLTPDGINGSWKIATREDVDRFQKLKDFAG